MLPPAPPGSQDEERLVAVRAALPALGAGIYLNTGTSGPLPAETAAAMDQVAAYELAVGRGHVDGFIEFLQRLEEARASVAALLTVDTDDIAITHATTDGMNIGVNGIDWRPGDRAVTSRMEHPGGVGPLYLQRERTGIEIDFLDIGNGGDDEAIVSAFDAAIDERTRAVVISHVLWSTGAVMPVRAIADIAHDRGALLIVDGAQSAGAIPVDVQALGADVYAISGQKWLLGPEGTGAVAVPDAVRDRLSPSVAGYFTFERLDSAGDAVMWRSARRYEGSSFHRPSVVGFARSVGWLSMFVGLAWIHERGTRMAALAHDRLSAIPGIHVLTPRHRMATLVSFRIDGWTPQEACDELGARVFAVTRTLPLVDALRISVAFFTSADELERFATAVELLAAHTPATIPKRRTLTLLDEA
ncbi:MAG: aminotransferase class V-fold PLP-dependent enzyme [Chloroflexota bacterium]